MKPSQTTLSLPPGVTEQGAKTTILTYAPELRFKDTERHFPGDPGDFNIQARFRESRSWKDREWNKDNKKWEYGNHHGAPFHGAPWQDISTQSLVRFPDQGQHDPPHSKTLRPRGGNNRLGGSKGLFLQRARHLNDASSGIRKQQPGLVQGPLLVDTDYRPDLGLVRVLYWFFYELNWWKIFITHEGDWEHVTYVFYEQAFKEGAPPQWVYFAQHDTGVFLEYRHLDPASGEHRIIFVDPDGHPCRYKVDAPFKYRMHWQTWDETTHPMQFVSKASWRDFAGAWGEVGESKHTTGPLGPFYKRHDDKVRITLVGGKPHVKLTQP